MAASLAPHTSGAMAAAAERSAKYFRSCNDMRRLDEKRDALVISKRRKCKKMNAADFRVVCLIALTDRAEEAFSVKIPDHDHPIGLMKASEAQAVLEADNHLDRFYVASATGGRFVMLPRDGDHDLDLFPGCK